jgi:hypothetical protein
LSYARKGPEPSKARTPYTGTSVSEKTSTRQLGEYTVRSVHVRVLKTEVQMQVLLNSIITTGIVAVFGWWANSRLEQLKSDLQGEMDAVVRKRAVYEQLAPALRVFSRRNLTDDQKDEFYLAYDRAYIWASDEVLTQVNKFIDLVTVENESFRSTQEERNAAYDKCMMSMRKVSDIPTQRPHTGARASIRGADVN